VPRANLDASVEAESSDEEISPRSAKRIKTELKEAKEELARVTTILQTAIPNSIQQHLRGVIRCCICQTVPIRPPIIVSRCCMSVIGCEQCIQQLIESRDNPAFPLCREASFSTMTIRLLGFDAFITAVRSYMQEEGDTTDNEP